MKTLLVIEHDAAARCGKHTFCEMLHGYLRSPSGERRDALRANGVEVISTFENEVIDKLAVGAK